MTVTIDFAWQRTLALQERCCAHEVQDGKKHTRFKPGNKMDGKDNACSTLHWRKTLGEQYSPFLTAHAQTESTFSSLLTEDYSATHVPQWALDISHLLETISEPRVASTDEARAQDRAFSEADLYKSVVTPWLNRGQKWLTSVRARMQARFPYAPIASDALIESLGDALAEQLAAMSARTVILELRIAELDGRINANSEPARWQRCWEFLRLPENVRALFREYPVLARQLSISERHWRRAICELLLHLCNDWPAIVRHFFPDRAPGGLQHVDFTGDHHRCGRRVASLRFSDGSRLVYKPSSIAAFEHFQSLLTWMNDRGHQPPFRPIRTLGRRSHGWVEYIAPKACENNAAVRRYYERIGGFIALAELLRLNDLHYENIIAKGEHPQLIDVETLFALPHHEDFSVVHTGLLPVPGLIVGGRANLDISGIGAPERQRSSYRRLTLSSSSEVKRTIEQDTADMPTGRHRPELSGQCVDPRNHANSIRKGYQRTYRHILAHRSELGTKNGPLQTFANDRVRVLVRPTERYARVERDCLHPDCLRDALRRERQLASLWREPPQFDNNTGLLRAEMRDLRRGDVPYFSVQGGKKEILDCELRPVNAAFRRAPIERVFCRLEAMSEQDLTHRQWQLDAALLELSARPFVNQDTAPENESFDETVGRIARYVRDRCLDLPEGPDWASWSSGAAGATLHPVGLNLYDGLAGIAIFLASFAERTRLASYRVLAESVVDRLCFGLQAKSNLAGLGAFTGWGGLVYALAFTGRLWDQPSLFDSATRIAADAPDVASDEGLDMISGAAGWIGALTALYECNESDQIRELALRAGDHLLQHAVVEGESLVWPTKQTNGRALTGFSHGNAGIAWALARLVGLGGGAKYQEAAHRALTFERELFCSAEKNWPDLRDDERFEARRAVGETIYSVAWCHGAPGIGLSRLAFAEYDPQARDEIDAAVETIQAKDCSRGHSLCHGVLGDLDLLIELRDQDEGLARAVHSIGEDVRQQVASGDWRLGTPGNIGSVGLMTGLAGIGYQLLRIAHPGALPSVLSLGLPRGSSKVGIKESPSIA